MIRVNIEEEEEEEEGRLKRLCDVMFSRWLVVFEISSVWMMYTTFLEVD
jgi:hypothetical protein